MTADGKEEMANTEKESTPTEKDRLEFVKFLKDKKAVFSDELPENEKVKPPDTIFKSIATHLKKTSNTLTEQPTVFQQEGAPSTGKVIIAPENQSFIEKQKQMLHKMEDLRTQVAKTITEDKYKKYYEDIDGNNQHYIVYKRTVETTSGTIQIDYLPEIENPKMENREQIRLRLLENKAHLKKTSANLLYEITIEKGGYFSITGKQGIYLMDENGKSENIPQESLQRASELATLYEKNKSKNPLVGNLISFLFRRRPQPLKISHSILKK